MKAYLHAVRIAPKKANLICKMIRGMTTADAMLTLERTNKKAARILEELLRSAMANASHNDKQDAQTLVIRSLIVNQGQAYHRGVPMARGRVRPMRKFLSHIELILGLPEDEVTTTKKTKRTKMTEANKTEAKTSQKGSHTVEKKSETVSHARARKADSARSKKSSSSS